jgi:hypothetical protein
MTEWLEELSARVRAGGYQVDFIPLLVYEWLDKAGRILATGAEKSDYLVKAADYRLAQLAAEVERSKTESNRRQLCEFATMRRSGEFSGSHIQDLKNLAKKMILFDMLLSPGQPSSQRKAEMTGNSLTIKS